MKLIEKKLENNTLVHEKVGRYVGLMSVIQNLNHYLTLTCIVYEEKIYSQIVGEIAWIEIILKKSNKNEAFRLGISKCYQSRSCVP